MGELWGQLPEARDDSDDTAAGRLMSLFHVGFGVRSANSAVLSCRPSVGCCHSLVEASSISLPLSRSGADSWSGQQRHIVSEVRDPNKELRSELLLSLQLSQYPAPLPSQSRAVGKRKWGIGPELTHCHKDIGHCLIRGRVCTARACFVHRRAENGIQVNSCGFPAQNPQHVTTTLFLSLTGDHCSSNHWPADTTRTEERCRTETNHQPTRLSQPTDNGTDATNNMPSRGSLVAEGLHGASCPCFGPVLCEPFGSLPALEVPAGALGGFS